MQMKLLLALLILLLTNCTNNNKPSIPVQRETVPNSQKKMLQQMERKIWR